MRPTLVTRRQLVVAGSTAFASAALAPAAWGRLTARSAQVGPGTFLDGVASGEPAPDAVTLWSRLTTDVPRSGAELVLCEDEGLTRTVASVVVPTSAGIDHCLKVRVTGLEPSRFYYYAWRSADGTSEVGRTKTAPEADADQDLAIGFSSCQRYPAGFFNAHRDAAARDLDLYVFLGDYTYEYPPTGPDADDSPNKPRFDPGASVDLASYRAKLRLYRSDADLRELHRLHPMVHIWDDHEVANNYTDDDPRPSDLQRTAAYRASFEWLPRMTFPDDRFRMYKTVRLGRMADLVIVDERQYREGGDTGAVRPGSILGRSQLAWFQDQLRGSQARWKLVANEVQFVPLTPLAPVQQGNSDAWDGYAADREAVLRTIEQVNAADTRYGGNVVFLTGDIHTFEANQVLRGGTSGRPVAVEYVGGSVSSAGASQAESTAVLATSPWIKQFNGAEHGWAEMRLSGGEAITEYRVSDITRSGQPSRTLSTWRQLAGANDLESTGAIPVNAPLPLERPELETSALAPTADLARRRRGFEAEVRRAARRARRA